MSSQNFAIDLLKLIGDVVDHLHNDAEPAAAKPNTLLMWLVNAFSRADISAALLQGNRGLARLIIAEHNQADSSRTLREGIVPFALTVINTAQYSAQHVVSRDAVEQARLGLFINTSVVLLGQTVSNPGFSLISRRILATVILTLEPPGLNRVPVLARELLSYDYSDA